MLHFSHLNLWSISQGCMMCRNDGHIHLHGSQQGHTSGWRHPLHCTDLPPVPIRTAHEANTWGEHRSRMAAAHQTQRPKMKQYWTEQNFSTQTPPCWLKRAQQYAQTTGVFLFSTYLSMYCHLNCGEENKISVKQHDCQQIGIQTKLATYIKC